MALSLAASGVASAMIWAAGELASARAVVEPNTGRWVIDLTLTENGVGRFDAMARQVGQGKALAARLGGG